MSGLDLIRLDERTIHLWTVAMPDQPGTSVAYAGDCLNSEERDRAARYRFDRDRQEFIWFRAHLRAMLAAYLGLLPGSVPLQTDEYGSPVLTGIPSNTLVFNLSHSSGLAIYAVSRQCKLGIDVERLRYLPDCNQIATRFFAYREVVELSKEDPLEDAFFRCWTRKEAFVKALGLGLQIPLSAFEVSLGAWESPHFKRISPSLSQDILWRLAHLEPAPGYVGAVAYSGLPRNLSWRKSDLLTRLLRGDTRSPLI